MAMRDVGDDLALQVKGDLKADRVKKSLEIVGAVLEKIKSSSGLARYRRKGHGGLLDGPVGMLIRIDGRCSLLVPRYLRKLDEARRVAVNLHNILPDQNLQKQLEQWKEEVSLAAWSSPAGQHVLH